MEDNIKAETSEPLFSVQKHESDFKSESFDRNVTNSLNNGFIEKELQPDVAQNWAIKLETDIMPVKCETGTAPEQKFETDVFITGQNCETSIPIQKLEIDLKNEPFDIKVEPYIPLGPVLKFDTNIVPVKYKADLLPVQKYEADLLVPRPNCDTRVLMLVQKHEIDDDDDNSNRCDDFSSVSFHSSPQYARSEETYITTGSLDDVHLKIEESSIRKIPKVVLVDCLKNGTKTMNRCLKSSIKKDRPQVIYNNLTNNSVSSVYSKPSSSNGNIKIQESILFGRRKYHSSFFKDACRKAYDFKTNIRSFKDLNKTNLLMEKDRFGIPKTTNKRRNTVIKNYECKKSHKIFCQKPALLQHIDNVHKRVKFECKKCDKLFSQKSHLLQHNNSVHESVKYKCNICDKLFSRKSHLLRHINSVHEGVKYECNMCHKLFSQKSYLLHHIISIHKRVKKYDCKMCHNSFSEKSSLLRHIKTVHEGVKYKCNMCDQLFTRKSYLLHHIISIHKGIKKHKSKMCHKLFSEKSILLRHINSVHEGVKYECNMCDKLFYQKSYLLQHINSVHEGVQYECNMCNKLFTRKSYFVHHIIHIHKGNKKYECKMCYKFFSEKSNLLRHIKTVHEGVKYECNMCDKLFCQKSHLLRHINSVHEGVKYECNMCDKLFCQKSYLLQHINSVHEGVKYECNMCDKQFCQKSSLLHHFISKHKGIVNY